MALFLFAKVRLSCQGRRLLLSFPLIFHLIGVQNQTHQTKVMMVNMLIVVMMMVMMKMVMMMKQ